MFKIYRAITIRFINSWDGDTLDKVKCSIVFLFAPHNWAPMLLVDLLFTRGRGLVGSHRPLRELRLLVWWTPLIFPGPLFSLTIIINTTSLPSCFVLTKNLSSSLLSPSKRFRWLDLIWFTPTSISYNLIMHGFSFLSFY